jgi:hypothetical protein
MKARAKKPAVKAGPDGRIGDSIVMLADEHPEVGARSPRAFGGAAHAAK